MCLKVWDSLGIFVLLRQFLLLVILGGGPHLVVFKGFLPTLCSEIDYSW